MRTLFLLALTLPCIHALKLAPDSSGEEEGYYYSPQISSDAEPVFYGIVMGTLAHQKQVRAWVASIRQIGGFKGTLVLVTDKPDCVAKTLQGRKLLGETVSVKDQVHIYGNDKDGRVHIVKAASTSSIIQMKLQKAKAWSNIRKADISHPVSSIVYLDEDIVVGMPLQKFLADVKMMERGTDPGFHLDKYKGGAKTAYSASLSGDRTKVPTIALFMDTGTSRGELHTGIVVFFKGAATQKCLNSWGTHLKQAEASAKLTEVTALKEATPEDVIDNEPSDDQVDSFWQESDHSGSPTRKTQSADNLLATDLETSDGKGAKLMGSDLVSEMSVTGPDQMALGKTSACRARGGIRILRPQYFFFPTTKRMLAREKKVFIHFTNTGRMASMSHSVMKKYYVDALGLPQDLDSFGNAQC